MEQTKKVYTGRETIYLSDEALHYLFDLLERSKGAKITNRSQLKCFQLNFPRDASQ